MSLSIKKHVCFKKKNICELQSKCRLLKYKEPKFGVAWKGRFFRNSSLKRAQNPQRTDVRFRVFVSFCLDFITTFPFFV